MRAQTIKINRHKDRQTLQTVEARKVRRRAAWRRALWAHSAPYTAQLRHQGAPPAGEPPRRGVLDTFIQTLTPPHYLPLAALSVNGSFVGRWGVVGLYESIEYLVRRGSGGAAPDIAVLAPRENRAQKQRKPRRQAARNTHKKNSRNLLPLSVSNCCR